MNIINPKRAKKYKFFEALKLMLTKDKAMKRIGWNQSYCYADKDGYGNVSIKINNNGDYNRYEPLPTDLTSEDWIVIDERHIDLSEEVKIANEIYRSKYGSTSG